MSVTLQSLLELRALLVPGIGFFVTAHKFTALDFAEIRPPKLVIVRQNRSSRIWVDYRAVEGSAARDSISVAPKGFCCEVLMFRQGVSDKSIKYPFDLSSDLE